VPEVWKFGGQQLHSSVSEDTSGQVLHKATH